MVTHAHVVLFLFADIVEKALPIITGSLQVSQTSRCLFCSNPLGLFLGNKAHEKSTFVHCLYAFGCKDESMSFRLVLFSSFFMCVLFLKAVFTHMSCSLFRG